MIIHLSEIVKQLNRTQKRKKKWQKNIVPYLSRRTKAFGTLPDDFKIFLIFALSFVLVIYPTKKKWVESNL